ncbi:hypothetical protein NPIL_219821, partial [Nephila pilipes]
KVLVFRIPLRKEQNLQDDRGGVDVQQHSRSY